MDSEVKIDKEFSGLIRHKLTDIQFWAWVRNWKDTDSICDQAEEWDIETKQNEIRWINKNILGGGNNA